MGGEAPHGPSLFIRAGLLPAPRRWGSVEWLRIPLAGSGTSAEPLTSLRPPPPFPAKPRRRPQRHPPSRGTNRAKRANEAQHLHVLGLRLSSQRLAVQHPPAKNPGGPQLPAGCRTSPYRGHHCPAGSRLPGGSSGLLVIKWLREGAPLKGPPLELQGQRFASSSSPPTPCPRGSPRWACSGAGTGPSPCSRSRSWQVPCGPLLDGGLRPQGRGCW